MRFVLGYGLNDISHMVDVAVAAEAAAFDSFTPWDVYNPLQLRQEKLDAVKRFSDEVVAKNA